ncbi:MAG: hypothetical protein JST96_14745 [Bacteroidetes bacterium]|nr:hypothetical protein [Bacteroidota bacterium]
MKKIFAILLLYVLLFNWVGYRLFVYCIENKVNEKFVAQLDNNNYDEDQLVSIKTPATHLSEYINSRFFERVDGQVEIKGIVYNYVKRRLFNDSLELLCIPNNPFTKIRNAKNDFFKLVNDIQHNGQGKKSANHSGLNKIFFAEYCDDHTSYDFSTFLFTAHSRSYSSSPRIISRCASAIDDPPENV